MLSFRERILPELGTDGNEERKEWCPPSFPPLAQSRMCPAASIVAANKEDEKSQAGVGIDVMGRGCSLPIAQHPLLLSAPPPVRLAPGSVAQVFVTGLSSGSVGHGR